MSRYLTTFLATGLGLALLLAMPLSPAGCSGETSTSLVDFDDPDEDEPGDGNGDTPAVAGYVVVDTAQELCYDDAVAITCPAIGQPFDGQDAQYTGPEPSYTLSADGRTVYDAHTGLTWQRSPDTNGDGVLDSDDKLIFAEARDRPAVLNAGNFGGFDDWRLPAIKELYSLIDFRGIDPSGLEGEDLSELRPFIDPEHFDFVYGDPEVERIIDAQYWSSTEYVSTTMDGEATAFGVNFADGRIKGYPTGAVGPAGAAETFAAFVRCVRGNADYGKNDFVDNGDGTITDRATELMWMQADHGEGVAWADALEYAEGLSLAGHTDWRLPDAKELQSIVDYTRSPATTGTAAIDPLFDSTPIFDEGGETNFGFYWASTTHANSSELPGANAVYLAFGEALGWMEPPAGGDPVLMDVHGAGAQRTDPKSGDPGEYPFGRGPQGDVVRIFNFVRCVRDAPSTP